MDLEVTGLVLLQLHPHLDVEGGLLALELLHTTQQLAEHLVEVTLQSVECVAVQRHGVNFVIAHGSFLLCSLDFFDGHDHLRVLAVELPDHTVHNLSIVTVGDAVQ